MINWINFLHLYQPANSDAYRIKEAVDLSYNRIVSALEKNPEIKFNLNISACLLLRLEEQGYLSLIKRIEKLVDGGQIELVSSAAYHALLPLIPESEVVWQINETKRVLKKFFPRAKIKGFFLPEMAYSSKVAKIIKRMGYSWLILDEISLDKKEKIDFNKIYRDNNSGLKIIFRSRQYSNCYVPLEISSLIKSKEEINHPIISATDGELYGLRHNDTNKSFEKLLKSKNINTFLISDYVKGKKMEDVKIRSSNWESTEEELANNKPFNLWFNKENEVHVYLWKFVKLVVNILNKYEKDSNYYWARWHFVRGLASCTFWWASANDFKHNFGPVAWNPDEVERGVLELVKSVRSLEFSTSKKEKIKAELSFINIKKIIWTKHWSCRRSF
ncbi:MAG: hypothetical protein WC280_00245 [Patescibacteria group bacterium]